MWPSYYEVRQFFFRKNAIVEGMDICKGAIVHFFLVEIKLDLINS